ncbi:MAG: hypothetical protein MK171_13005 [Pirellulales bacterium]|nr:hypothetical protein [Pirellulales bacterium]
MKTIRFTFSIWTLMIATTCLAPGDCWGQRRAFNLPPSQRLMEPGPGVGGPGPGVLMVGSPGAPSRGVSPAAAASDRMAGAPPMSASATSQMAFLGVEGGEVSWDSSGQGQFDSVPLVMPGRQNFPQGAIYRLKLTNLPDREGVELYPTLEVAPVTPRTDAFLAHAPIPIQFTDEDLDQVLTGNFVTKVIYLPDPEFQELALSGVETLVSTRLGPGVDPIAEADRRGSIMAILRVGNLDLQLPGQGLAMQGGVGQALYQDGLGSQQADPKGLAPQEVPSQGGIQQEYSGQENVGQEFGSLESDGGYSKGYGAPAPPQGMPTSAFAPHAVPPHLVSGMTTPQWGMPSVGTPIGLPGPPHIPLGHKAGLTSHTIRNHTRVKIPPPVHRMKIDVKQRPGMNYPRPVNHVKIAETNRAGFRVQGGTLAPALPAAIKKLGALLGAPRGNCRKGYCD